MRITHMFIAASLFIGGCTAKKLAVNHADLYLESQITKRLPLYESQKKELSKDIDKFLNNQKEHAEEAITHIKTIELDVNKVDDQYDKLERIYKKLALNFSKLMSHYMAPLDDKQSKDFIETLRGENRKIMRQKDEMMENLEEKFEDLFGTITDKQKKLLEGHKDHFLSRQEIRLKRRKELHDRFAEIYKMDLSSESKEKYFYEAFTEYLDKYPNSPKNKEIIKEIIPTLNGDQKQAFEEKTKDLKEILGYYLESHY